MFSQLLISSKLGKILTGKYPDQTEESRMIFPLVWLWLRMTVALQTIGKPVNVKENDKALEKFKNTLFYHEGL